MKKFLAITLIAGLLIASHFSTLSAYAETFTPITITIPKRDFTGYGYYFWAAYFLRHNPAIFGGLLAIGGIGYLLDSDVHKPEEIAAITGMTGAHFYMQTLENRDVVSLAFNTGLILLGALWPEGEPNFVEYIPNGGIFTNADLGIDSGKSWLIYEGLQKQGIIKRRSYYFGILSDQADSLEKIRALKIENHQEHESFVKGCVKYFL